MGTFPKLASLFQALSALTERTGEFLDDLLGCRNKFQNDPCVQ
jgi:hypothetical protein